MKKEIKNIKNIQLITCVEKTAIRGGKKQKGGSSDGTQNLI